MCFNQKMLELFLVSVVFKEDPTVDTRLKVLQHNTDICTHINDHLFYCLFADIECAKSYAKMAESAKTLASQQVSGCCG